METVVGGSKLEVVVVVRIVWSCVNGGGGGCTLCCI